MSRFLIFHFMIWISRSLFNETPYKLPHFFPSFLSFIFRPHITHLYPSLSLNIPLNSPFQLWILSSKTVYIFFANCLFVKAVILSYIHLLFSCYGLLVSTENDSFFFFSEICSRKLICFSGWDPFLKLVMNKKFHARKYSFGEHFLFSAH